MSIWGGAETMLAGIKLNQNSLSLNVSDTHTQQAAVASMLQTSSVSQSETEEETTHQ